MTVRNVVELTCKEVVELITEYLSHALPPEEQARLEQHLLTCGPCTAHLGQLKATIEITGKLGEQAPPAEERELVGLFRRWKKG
jgi:hypothetical protein